MAAPAHKRRRRQRQDVDSEDEDGTLEVLQAGQGHVVKRPAGVSAEALTQGLTAASVSVMCQTLCTAVMSSGMQGAVQVLPHPHISAHIVCRVCNLHSQMRNAL